MSYTHSVPPNYSAHSKRCRLYVTHCTIIHYKLLIMHWRIEIYIQIFLNNSFGDCPARTPCHTKNVLCRSPHQIRTFTGSQFSYYCNKSPSSAILIHILYTYLFQRIPRVHVSTHIQYTKTHICS